MALKGSAVVSLVNAIVPLYILMVLGYVLIKFHVLTYEKHYAGIVTFCFKVTCAPLIFQLVAMNNPYTLNLRLIGADTLYKAGVLVLLSLSCFWRFTAHQVAFISTYFNLATMSNTVLVGIPLVTALYPGTEKDLTAIVFMQCLLWFSVCIFILELYKVVGEKSSRESSEALDDEHFQEAAATLSGNSLGLLHNEKDMSDVSAQEQTAPAATSPVERHNHHHIAEMARNGADVAAPSPRVSGAHRREIGLHAMVAETVVVRIDDDKEANACGTVLETARRNHSSIKLHEVQKVLVTVGKNFVWSPVVWSSILGFAYALINFKFYDGKPFPAILKTTVSLLANCTLGMAMFMLGMHMAAQKKLMACGISQAIWGAVIRFVFSPVAMMIASLVFGLRGEMLRFATLQAMIPQAISSFIFASNYQVHEDIFSTAVWFQTLIFFPFAIALYSILNLTF